MDNELISVIIPVYKVEPYLDRCIQSIVDQTYQDLEIILVDDGSPDKCPSLCDKWALQNNQIRVIHKENGGLSDARNAGLKVATGNYIAFVDSDDWIAPKMLERLLAALQKDKSDIAACTVEMVWDDGKPLEFLTVQTNCTLNRIEAQKELLEEHLLKQPVWYKLYKRETIGDITFEVDKQHEDVFWSYQVIGNADKVSIIDYVGYYYFQRSDSIMGNGYSLKNLDAMEAYEKRYEYIKDYFPELEKEARVSLANACIFNGQMALKYLKGENRKKAFVYLVCVMKRYTLTSNDYPNLKISHRLWLSMAKKNLMLTCRMKNLLGVGL